MRVERLRNAWRNIRHSRRAAQELDEEIRGAFEALVDDRVRQGIAPDDARRAVALHFGGVESVKDRVRDVRAGAWVDTLCHDLRYAARLLRRNPVFTAVAAFSLAIGIGATTTIFTVANGLLFRTPDGTGRPEQLVDVFRAVDGQAMANFTTSYPYYRDIRDRATTLSGLFAFDLNLKNVTVGSSDGAEMAFAMVVTSNYFSVLEVAPSAGRLFDAVDDSIARDTPFVVLSHRFWRRRFGQNTSILGQTLQINRRPFTVIGVADERFRGTNVAAPDLWLPMAMIDDVERGSRRLTSRTLLDLGMGGRLRSGASRAQAAAELDTLALTLAEEDPAAEEGTRVRVAPLSSVPGPIARVAAGLFAALLLVVFTVLVVAGVNVSSVLLARAAARRREIAVRVAMGAGRRRLIRQFLTETALLFAIGGTMGLFLARGTTSLVLALLPALPVPIVVSLPLDAKVVAFAVVVSMIAAALAGIAPALHAARADVVVALKDESQGPSNRLRLRSAFVVAQVALSIALVVVASLLVQALRRTSAVDQGFDPRRVETASLDLTAAGYTNSTGAVVATQLRDGLRAIPGIDSVALSQWAPGRGGADVAVTVPGVESPPGETTFTATWNAITPDFFRALMVPLSAGRDFGADDRADSEPVAIVSESTARILWPGRDPIGNYVTWLERGPGQRVRSTSLRVVGVVRDVSARTGGAARIRDRGQRSTVRISRPMLMMYVPLSQRFALRTTLLVRAATDRRLAAAIRDYVKRLDPDIPLAPPQPLDLDTGPIYLQLRLAASVAGSVGAIGLLLAAIGVYGVAAYTTQCRTREFGVRMALGARRGDVMRMVVGQSMGLVAIGSGVGLALAVAASRLFRALLTGVSAFDLATLGGAALLFMLVGLAASLVPALRVTRIDAMDALRYE